MKTPAPADLQRWSEELARNPASLAFLPLARAYRRLGRRDLATRLCLRGLEAHPANVEAHALLALLYLEAGDRARAADEWSIVLRLKPGNFEALRGMGFRYLEQNDIPRARQHLERAALIRPGDTAVQEALRLLRQRQVAMGSEQAADAPPAPSARAGTSEPPVATSTEESIGEESAGAERTLPEPWAETLPASEAPGEEPPELVLEEPWAVAGGTAASEEEIRPGPAETVEAEGLAGGVEPPRAAGPVPTGSVARAAAKEPARTDPDDLFAELVRDEHIIGVLLLDPRGLVLAGSFGEASGEHAGDVGAILGAAVTEAARTAAYLELGRWTGMLMESESAVVHVLPVADQGLVVLAARPGAPTGWVLRAAAQAARRAARFLEVPA